MCSSDNRIGVICIVECNDYSGKTQKTWAEIIRDKKATAIVTTIVKDFLEYSKTYCGEHKDMLVKNLELYTLKSMP